MANSLRNSADLCARADRESALRHRARARDCRDPERASSRVQSFVLDNKTNLINSARRASRRARRDHGRRSDRDGARLPAQSEWRFKGHVRVTLDIGRVTSDTAVFTFADKQLSRGELVGNATFEDEAGGRTPRGRANKIVYDDNAQDAAPDRKRVVRTRLSTRSRGCDCSTTRTTKRVTSGLDGLQRSQPDPNAAERKAAASGREAPAAAPAQ